MREKVYVKVMREREEREKIWMREKVTIKIDKREKTNRKGWRLIEKDDRESNYGLWRQWEKFPTFSISYLY